MPNDNMVSETKSSFEEFFEGLLSIAGARPPCVGQDTDTQIDHSGGNDSSPRGFAKQERSDAAHAPLLSCTMAGGSFCHPIAHRDEGGNAVSGGALGCSCGCASRHEAACSASPELPELPLPSPPS